MNYIKRVLTGLFFLALTKGIFIYLATQDVHPEKWVAKALGYVLNPDLLSSIVWIISGLFGLVGLIFEPEIINFLRKIFRNSPIEIIFDPRNPAKKFWSLEMQKDKKGNSILPVCWHYRVEVRNNSLKTLKNLRVSVETTGQVGSRPLDMPFDKTHASMIDINPQCSELVTILRWPHPTIQAGMLAGPSALEYGPVKIIASADDVPPKIRIFQFDYQQTPMIFD